MNETVRECQHRLEKLIGLLEEESTEIGRHLAGSIHDEYVEVIKNEIDALQKIRYNCLTDYSI